MIKPTILFQIELGYEHEHYKKLISMAISKPIKTEQHTYLWIFQLSNIGEVIKALSKPIIIDEMDINLVLKQRSGYVEIERPEFKGKSGYDVLCFPKIYKVIEHRKVEEEGGQIKVKEVTHTIPVENVQALWGVMKKYQIGKEIETRTVAENYCKAIGIQDYYSHQSEDHTFCFRTFFGSRSKGYFPFYYSLKVLQYYKVIEHHLYGKIKRTAENWEHQTNFGEIKC